LVISFAAPEALRAERAVAAVCEQVARAVAAETGVPEDVLRSISLTETGRSKDGAFLPWPWTVNMEGIGKWFDTYAEAQAYVDRNVARGARSFDIGCFQINYRWHGEAFASIEEMFDPMANARYAARFLGDLYAEFGDWSRAAGAFHSRTPALARKYATRFDRIRARLSAPLPEPDYEDSYLVADAAPARAREPAIRQNRYPLLQSGGAPSGLASLVPGAVPSASGRFLPIGAVQPIGFLR
jgi:hypothetical protein